MGSCHIGGGLCATDWLCGAAPLDPSTLLRMSGPTSSGRGLGKRWCRI